MDPPKIVASAAVKVPGLLPGFSEPPSFKLNAPTLPDPPKLPPLFTVTAPAVPFTLSNPPFTVARELDAIDPFVSTSNVP